MGSYTAFAMKHGLSPFFSPAPLFWRGKGETELGYERQTVDGDEPSNAEASEGKPETFF
ncbi:MAG: hypothetical protein K9H62_03590 [Bacteroidales bacterium]|nr:hypothetical protein [Bacteroidales bacterium]